MTTCASMADPTVKPPPSDFKGSGRFGAPIPGEIPGGPKPLVWRGMVMNSKVCSGLARAWTRPWLWLTAQICAVCVCVQMVFFYGFLFVVPPALTFFLYSRGKTQATREEILNSESYKAKMREKYGEESEERVKELKAQMNKVLFETKGTMRTEWAIKRDEERKRKAEEAAAAKAA